MGVALYNVARVVVPGDSIHLHSNKQAHICFSSQIDVHILCGVPLHLRVHRVAAYCLRHLKTPLPWINKHISVFGFSAGFLPRNS